MIRTGYPHPIAYTYEADHHCPECTAARFGEDDGFPPESARDGEGNPIGAVAPWDEWQNIGEGSQALACGTCGSIIDTYTEEDSVSEFVVIENTPGYLPEDDDPATFETIEEARVYASDLLSRLLDSIYEGQEDDPEPAGFEVHGSFAQEDMSVLVYDESRTHDLGRVIEILRNEP